MVCALTGLSYYNTVHLLFLLWIIQLQTDSLLKVFPRQNACYNYNDLSGACI